MAIPKAVPMANTHSREDCVEWVLDWLERFRPDPDGITLSRPGARRALLGMIERYHFMSGPGHDRTLVAEKLRNIEKAAGLFRNACDCLFLPEGKVKQKDHVETRASRFALALFLTRFKGPNTPADLYGELRLLREVLDDPESALNKRYPLWRLMGIERAFKSAKTGPGSVLEKMLWSATVDLGLNCRILIRACGFPMDLGGDRNPKLLQMIRAMRIAIENQQHEAGNEARCAREARALELKEPLFSEIESVQLLLGDVTSSIPPTPRLEKNLRAQLRTLRFRAMAYTGPDCNVTS